MAVKCDPDAIYIDGMEGGTGAGPHLATEETGVPGIAAIRQARKAFDDLGVTGKISLVYAGGIRNGADVAKAIALGADAIAIGHSALMALNCNKDIDEANYPEEPEIIPYVVRRGDTLGRIAGRHSCVSLQELAAMNNIRAPRYMIRVGQTIKIPGCS